MIGQIRRSMASRITRVTAGRGEDGQGLIVVLFVTMILMGLVIGATSTTASQVIPSRQAVDSEAALAAAQGGVQDFVAKVNGMCPRAGSCSAITSYEPVATPLAGGRTTFTWSILNTGTYLADGFLRVRSVGTANAGSTNTVSRTLIADVKGSANLTDYLFYTQYETESAQAVTDRYPKRVVPISAAIAAKDFTHVTPFTSDVAVLWNGAGSSTKYPAVSSCDRHWYNERGSGAPVGRYSSRVAAGDTDPINSSIDYGEVGSIAGVAVADRAGACELSFSSNSTMNGKVFSLDALLLSSSVAGGKGPTFRDTVETGWSRTDTPSVDTSKYFRTFAGLRDSAPAIGSKLPQGALSAPVLPTWSAADVAAKASCTYTGPTRIRVVGATVVVTSPLTKASTTNTCFTSKAAATTTAPTVGGVASVLEATYPYAGKTIYVKDAPAATPATIYAPTAGKPRTPANSLFVSTGQSSSTTSTVTHSPSFGVQTPVEKWAIPAGPTQFQNPYEANQTFVAFTAAFKTAMAGYSASNSTLTAAVNASLTTAFNGTNAIRGTALIGSTGRSYGWTTASNADAADPASSASSVVSVAGAGVSADPLLQNSGTDTVGVSGVVQSVTATVSRQGLRCSIAYVSGLCLGTWATDGTAPQQQFSITVTDLVTTAGKTTVQVSAFPLAGDRTGYSTSKGDAYVEGTASGAISIAADHNVVVTGNTTQGSGATPTVPSTEVPFFTSNASDAIVLTAQQDVTVYHPVLCRSAAGEVVVNNAAAVPAVVGDNGYCPNDLTGLYTGGMSSTTFDDAHPSRQYINMLTSPVSRIDAVIYALGGSLTLLNYNRGTGLGTLAVNGGVYQVHHGVTGVEWEVLTNAAGARPVSGYAIDYRHDNTLTAKTQGSAFPYFPSSTNVGLIWNLQGVSEKVGS